jgi:hypothetical protein
VLSVLVFDRSGHMGMYWSVNCAEDGAFDPAGIDLSAIRPELAKDQETSMQAVLSLCQAWGSAPLGPEVNAPVTGDVPALIFSGRFDPITPLPYAEEVAAGLSRSTLVAFRDMGHGLLGSSDCAESLLAAFLDAPERPLDTTCARQAPSVDFKDSNDYIPFPFMALLQGLLAFRMAIWLGLLGLLPAWIMLLSSLVVHPIGWLVSRLRRPRPDDPQSGSSTCLARLTPGLSMLAALCSLVLVLGLGALMLRAVFSNDVVVLFGLPAEARFFVFLAPVMAVLSVLMLVGTFYGLFDRDWSVWRKIYQALVSLAALVLVAAMTAAGWMTAWW